MSDHRRLVDHSCHCLCGNPRWPHLGACNGTAETSVRFDSELVGACDVPVCYPCATAILSVRFQLVGDHDVRT